MKRLGVYKMNNIFFSLIVFNYGFTILYRKIQDIDGLAKYKISYNFGDYSDWQIAIRLFYRYVIIFRLNMNR